MIGRWLASWRKRSQRRRRVVPLWRSRRALTVGGLLLAAAVAGGGVWAWSERVPQRFADAVRSSLVETAAGFGFRVREVFVVGRKHTPRPQLLAALGVDRGSPILALDPWDARARLVALPWVREASVERLLPDTVVVRLVEREPVALWQRRGTFSLLDGGGEVIAVDDVAPFRQLVVVVGDDAPAHVADLLRMLAKEPELAALVRAAVRIGGRRWNLRLDGDIDVRLPEQDPAAAWRRLADYQRQHRLLSKGLRSIDLRFGDRLIVRRSTTPTSAKADKGSGA
jgi:cell division protein FtsQ